MPMIFVNEAQRKWLEHFGQAYRIEWLRKAAALECPKRRGLPESHWRGNQRLDK